MKNKKIDLQWFADGEVEIEIDPNVDPDGVDRSEIPKLNWQSDPADDYDITVEGVGDVVEEPSQTQEELIAEVAKLKEDLTSMSSQADSNKALQEAVLSLGQNLQQPAAPVQQVQPSMETEEEFKKKVDEGQYEGDLYGLMMEFQKRKIGPEVQSILQSNLYNSKRFVELDPKMGLIYKKYQTEIENEVNQLPPVQKLKVPDIYKKVTELVASRHMDEIMNETVEARVAEEVKKQLEKHGLTGGGQAAELRAPNWSENSSNRPASTPGSVGEGGKIKGKLTNAEAAFAERKGILVHQLWETLRNNPTMKKQINDGRL
jgi:hypothetical protein